MEVAQPLQLIYLKLSPTPSRKRTLDFVYMKRYAVEHETTSLNGPLPSLLAESFAAVSVEDWFKALTWMSLTSDHCMRDSVPFHSEQANLISRLDSVCWNSCWAWLIIESSTRPDYQGAVGIRTRTCGSNPELPRGMKLKHIFLDYQ